MRANRNVSVRLGWACGCRDATKRRRADAFGDVTRRLTLPPDPRRGRRRIKHARRRPAVPRSHVTPKASHVPGSGNEPQRTGSHRRNARGRSSALPRDRSPRRWTPRSRRGRGDGHAGQRQAETVRPPLGAGPRQRPIRDHRWGRREQLDRKDVRHQRRRLPHDRIMRGRAPQRAHPRHRRSACGSRPHVG